MGLHGIRYGIGEHYATLPNNKSCSDHRLKVENKTKTKQKNHNWPPKPNKTLLTQGNPESWLTSPNINHTP